MSEYDLIAACWTTAGACTPLGKDDRSSLSINERVEAAASAGFTGFGIRYRDLMTVEHSLGFKGFRTLLENNGIRHVELEFLEDWYAEGTDREKSDLQRRDLLRASEILGARHIKVGGHLAGGELDFNKVVDEFIQLADEAEAAGTRVALEPMPFADIKTPQMGLEIVKAAGQTAGGLLVDIWHVARASVDFVSLASLPIENIFAVELDDADAEIKGTLLEDTVNERRFPGEGALNVQAFVDEIKKIGYTGPWGVEMLSTEFRKLPLVIAAQRAYDTSIRFLNNEVS